MGIKTTRFPVVRMCTFLLILTVCIVTLVFAISKLFTIDLNPFSANVEQHVNTTTILGPIKCISTLTPLSEKGLVLVEAWQKEYATIDEHYSYMACYIFETVYEYDLSEMQLISNADSTIFSYTLPELQIHPSLVDLYSHVHELESRGYSPQERTDVIENVRAAAEMYLERSVDEENRETAREIARELLENMYQNFNAVDNVQIIIQ